MGGGAGVGVSVDVLVEVGVAVGVSVDVGVSVGPTVGVSVGLGVAVGGTGVGVAVGFACVVAAGVAVGVTSAATCVARRAFSVARAAIVAMTARSGVGVSTTLTSMHPATSGSNSTANKILLNLFIVVPPSSYARMRYPTLLASVYHICARKSLPNHYPPLLFHCDLITVCGHYDGVYRGRSKEKVVPSPGRLWTRISPPCCSTIRLTMASPNPLPLRRKLRGSGAR